MAEILFTEGPFNGHKLDIPETGIVFGRAEDADLVIDDGEISSHHAQLRTENGAWCIFDLESSNGTMVNGSPITGVPLSNGDIVTLGATSFTFTSDASEAPIETTPTEPVEDAPPEEPPVQDEMQDQETISAPEAVDEQLQAEPEPEQDNSPEPPTSPPPPAKESGLSTGGGASEEDVALVKSMKQMTDNIKKEVGKVIIGQVEMLDQILMCMIAGGHALLIGLPGMAKTLTVFTIAKVLDMDFKRVQFTPDLMPTDIVGSDVLETNKETGEKEFRFIKGPIFCNLLLADEINRTPPKTQAALLEAMQEKRVTAGNTTYTLDKPFFVLATQNPIEQEGTYPLPEAQLDRFMFNIWVDYPLQDEEEKIIGATTTGGLNEPQRILTREQVIQLQSVVKKIPVSDHVIKYVIRLVRATRPQYDDAPEVTKKYISTGAGPRAGQNLVLAAKAMAVLEGRIHVSCADIRRATRPVMRHRLATNFAADSEGMTTMDIVEELLKVVQEPGSEAYAPAATPQAGKAAAPAAAPAKESRKERAKREKAEKKLKKKLKKK